MSGLIEQAEEMLLEGRTRAAAVVLEALAVRMPHSARVALAQARALRGSGAGLGAAQAAEHAHRCDPGHAQAAGFWASLLLEQGRAGQAACVLDSAIEAGAVEPALHALLAATLLQLGEPAAARLAAGRGLAAFPNHPELRDWAERADANL